MRNAIIAGIFIWAAAVCSPLFAQTNADEVAQLKQRVAQLEKQVQDISKFIEPLRGQQDTITTRRKALQETIEKRIAQDRDKHTPDEVIEAERLYRIISQKGGTPEAAQSIQTMLTKFTDFNRTGCALLYTAQRATGEEHVKELQECIDKYSDCIYGDGVQVGAFARYILARDYIAKGEDKKAEALAAEIKHNYSGAIDHTGNLLLDLQGKITR